MSDTDAWDSGYEAGYAQGREDAIAQLEALLAEQDESHYDGFMHAIGIKWAIERLKKGQA